MKWLRVFWILILFSRVLSGDSPVSGLLTSNDYELEAVLKEQRPALSSATTDDEPWESHNEWRCFAARDIELTCVEIEYGEWRKSPVIIITSGEHRFEYDLDPTFHWNCDFTLDEWRQVIGYSSEVCLFGAFLQPLDKMASLWVLSQLKSELGYWKEHESKSYKHAQQYRGEGQDDAHPDF